MKLLLHAFREMRAMVLVLVVFSVPAAVLFVYLSMHVDTALLERRIRHLERRQQVLFKKNQALRREIERLAHGGERAAGYLPDPDRIVHIRLGSADAGATDAR